jgi:hypothetical protein
VVRDSSQSCPDSDPGGRERSNRSIEAEITDGNLQAKLGVLSFSSACQFIYRIDAVTPKLADSAPRV